MIKIEYGKDKQVSKHFMAHEFYCKCGCGESFCLDRELINKLELLHDILDCKAIIVTSGYRCGNHDKNVGGSGTGQHTKGTAVDVKCIGKDGKTISTKIISCVAQLLGFNGIANINNTYTCIHLDTGDRVYFGDETKGTHTITDNFFNYYHYSPQFIGGLLDIAKHPLKVYYNGENIAEIEV